MSDVQDGVLHRAIRPGRAAPEHPHPKPQNPEGATISEMTLVDPREAMTPRQVELLALYASGHDMREIATLKFLSYSSVQQTLQAARVRVGARTLTHLCVLCVETGVIVKNGVGYRPVQAERVVGE